MNLSCFRMTRNEQCTTCACALMCVWMRAFVRASVCVCARAAMKSFVARLCTINECSKVPRGTKNAEYTNCNLFCPYVNSFLRFYIFTNCGNPPWFRMWYMADKSLLAYILGVSTSLRAALTAFITRGPCTNRISEEHGTAGPFFQNERLDTVRRFCHDGLQQSN
jgi:hypothetical protein